MAPEVMRLEEYDQTADVHSFGLILYELATGHEPFESYTEIDPFVTALCYNHERPNIEPSEDTPAALVELMKQCWHPDPRTRPTFPVIVDTLVQLIVDSAMPEDTPARAFWKRNFLKPSLQELVAWCDLEEIIAAGVPSVPPSQVGKLETLVGVAVSEFEQQRFVTMERFYQFFQWFGKWFEPAGEALLREMIEMVEAPWFHGDISLDESASRLRFRENNTFLVRLSFKDPKTPFTISSMSSGQTVHRRIYRLTYDPRKAERFAVQLIDKGPFTKYPSLSKLVLALQQQSVLGAPCPKDVIKVAY
jgi:serine/threonine protein kinase